MKMMIAFRWTRTPMTPMMKSAAVRARDSASTDGPSAAEYHGAGNGDEQQYARQLESKEIVLEERRGHRSNRIQLLQLLFVEVAWDDELLRQLRAQDYHDLAEKAEANEASRQAPAHAVPISHARRRPEPV